MARIDQPHQSGTKNLYKLHICLSKKILGIWKRHLFYKRNVIVSQIVNHPSKPWSNSNHLQPKDKISSLNQNQPWKIEASHSWNKNVMDLEEIEQYLLWIRGRRLRSKSQNWPKCRVQLPRANSSQRCILSTLKRHQYLHSIMCRNIWIEKLP